MTVKFWSDKRLKAVWVVLFLFGFYLQLPAQTASSTRDGVYTASQAQEGKALYNKECAMCHGAKLQGAGGNPSLAGDDFLNSWDGQSLADLDVMIRTTMPATHPGSLTQADTTKLIAYILSVNKFPAGKKALSTDTKDLKSIQIQKPQPKS